MKTWNAKIGEVEKKWWIMDASARPLGRLATEVAMLLRGKHKPEFTPHVDTGDFVLVVNAKGVKLTGKKWTDKQYFFHSGYFGALKEKRAKDISNTLLIKNAVSGMLPKNKMRKHFMTKLKVYEGVEHPHKAQKPAPYAAFATSIKSKKPACKKPVNSKAADSKPGNNKPGKNKPGDKA